jgi:hypothetical protein
MYNVEMLINIYKNRYDDALVGGFSSMEKFMVMEETLMDENEDVIASLGLLELNESNNMVYVSFISFFLFFCFFFIFQVSFFFKFDGCVCQSLCN